ncbi:Hypothetical predicted protein [Octopus vulgaris]|uniref:Uncharacterized protein n=1 Tax=Octopus vulgaris TaxID=6645 RepID=A0AA36BCI9_OCTVU|nr:Hypothetical predicted protein [Octopus vulgaris]
MFVKLYQEGVERLSKRKKSIWSKLPEIPGKTQSSRSANRRERSHHKKNCDLYNYKEDGVTGQDGKKNSLEEITQKTKFAEIHDPGDNGP